MKPKAIVIMSKGIIEEIVSNTEIDLLVLEDIESGDDQEQIVKVDGEEKFVFNSRSNVDREKIKRFFKTFKDKKLI